MATQEEVQFRRVVYMDGEGEVTAVTGEDVFGANSLGVIIIEHVSPMTSVKSLIPWTCVMKLSYWGQDEIIRNAMSSPRPLRTDTAEARNLGPRPPATTMEEINEA